MLSFEGKTIFLLNNTEIFLKNNLDKAQEFLITANLLDSNHFRALNNLGNLNRKLHKLDRAIEYYKLAIKNMPSNAKKKNSLSNYNRLFPCFLEPWASLFRER